MLYLIHRGRLRNNLYVTIIGILTIAAFLYLYSEYNNIIPKQTLYEAPGVQVRTKPHLSKLVTVVFRQFEEFENDVADSVQSFVTAYPNMPIVILCESPPYPPFPFSYSNDTLKNLQIVSLGFRLDAPPESLRPLSYISTEYVLFVPDSTRVLRRTLQQAIAAITESHRRALAIPIGNAQLICQIVNWDYADWTLQYRKIETDKPCDAVTGHHALLIKTSLLQCLPQPFVLPFPEGLYLQTAMKEIKINILESKLGPGRSVLKSPLAKQKALKQSRENRWLLYKQLGVKLLVREDSTIQWLGCKKQTVRCFPSVQNVPSYLHERRNTPPCCRRNMRRTAAHVLRTLTEAGARCWLETTSLLGAVIHNDLLPWAEYVEIGIHAHDVPRVPYLQRSGVDPAGFVWERATKGHYYRVAYSQTNRIYALILPFMPRNGTMKPVDWVMAHQKQFPERHMHPLAQIKFAGRPAPAPNDASAFLDHKLGARSIERCHKLGPRLLYHNYHTTATGAGAGADKQTKCKL